MLPRVFALTVHANWTCRHSGACCTAGWAIPVEPERRLRLGGELLTPRPDGSCRFYDREGARCRVHRDEGEAMLPSSCFHFPRRALLDDRGVRLSLSHFCPTAAELLVSSADPVEIVEAPAAFPGWREYDGLDGRGAWPPLIKADLLFDLDGYSAWEEHVVRVLTRTGADAVHAASGTATRVLTSDGLRRLAADAETLRQWQPGDGPLAALVAGLAGRARGPNHGDADGGRDEAWWRYRALTVLPAWEAIMQFVPVGLAVPELTDEDRALWARTAGAFLPAAARQRYVAAKAFASWSAYEAFGVRTMVAELVLADLVLRVEAVRAARRAGLRDDAWSAGLPHEQVIAAVRAADWLLVHLVDRPDLMAWLGRVETRTEA